MFNKNTNKIILLTIVFITFTFLLSNVLRKPYKLNTLNSESISDKETIVIWGTIENLDEDFEIYESTRDDIHIEYTYYEPDKFNAKVRNGILTGKDVADICIMDNTDLHYFDQWGIWEDLIKSPYKLNLDDLLDSSVKNIVNNDHEIIGVPYLISVTGLVYNKQLAKEIIGTDDDNIISIKLKSWANLIGNGQEYKNIKNDFLYFPGIHDVGTLLFYQTSNSYVDEHNALLNPQRFYNYFKTLHQIKYLDLVGDIKQFSFEWYESFNYDNILFYSMPLNALDSNILGDGEWGLALPPGGSVEWGGNSIAIPKRSENKELAYSLIKDMYLSLSGAYYHKNKPDGYFINYKPAYDDINYLLLNYKEFGNQNIGATYFNSLIPNVNSFNFNYKTSEIYDIYMDSLDLLAYEDNQNADTVYKYFLEKLEEINVEVSDEN